MELGNQIKKYRSELQISQEQLADRIYVSKNYVFYRIEEKYIRIINLYYEKEDFMWQLFGVDTTSQETIDYWNE